MTPKYGALVDESGWLATGRIAPKKRYYYLKGVILSQHKQPRTPPLHKVPVLGTEIVLKPKKLTICLPEVKLVLTAQNTEEYEQWAVALDTAAKRRLEHYYEVGNWVGEGMFSTVRVGTDKRTGQKVAVKDVPKSNLKAKDLKRLQTEALILTTSSHPNIVQGFDVFDEPDRLYFVMEFLAGGSLAEGVQKRRPLSELQLKVVCRSILGALYSLHSVNIVHRDMKLENIMFKDDTENLCPKIIDFGFGTHVQEDDEDGSHLLQTVLGTWHYIAPEQANRQPYGIPVDMWAFGVILYWMVAEEFPFDADTGVAVLKKIRNDEVEYGPKWDLLPRSWRDLCEALLERDQSKRLTSHEALSHPALTISSDEDIPSNLYKVFSLGEACSEDDLNSSNGVSVASVNLHGSLSGSIAPISNRTRTFPKTSEELVSLQALAPQTPRSCGPRLETKDVEKRSFKPAKATMVLMQRLRQEPPDIKFGNQSSRTSMDSESDLGTPRTPLSDGGSQQAVRGGSDHRTFPGFRGLISHQSPGLRVKSPRINPKDKNRTKSRKEKMFAHKGMDIEEVSGDWV